MNTQSNLVELNPIGLPENDNPISFKCDFDLHGIEISKKPPNGWVIYFLTVEGARSPWMLNENTIGCFDTFTEAVLFLSDAYAVDGGGE